MDEALEPFHLPQHTRRVKLRTTPPTDDLHTEQLITMAAAPALPTEIPNALNLSLATHSRAGHQRSGKSATALGISPIGPFTGYASILSRSRFLLPAEEILADFCAANRRGVSDLDARALEPPCVENWGQKVAHRCGDSNLLSILHEVYKRYKLYHQQMQSAVSSFESVAGLGNAAPFISYAIKAVSKHFHCLKKAILDYINFTNAGSNNNDFRSSRNSSGLYSTDKSHVEQRPHQQLQFRGSMQHPTWRSQRGFPEKAVVVLRTWLFENFLHPYPTDTDKEMLARRTGLSRSQVSNWFTNARVRLWKPMVEEIHTLDKQRQFPSESEQRKFVNVLADHFSSANPHPPEKESPMEWLHKMQESENRRNIQVGRMQPNLYLTGPGGKSEADKNSSSSSAYGGAEESGNMGLTWSNCGQTVPFWLAK